MIKTLISALFAALFLIPGAIVNASAEAALKPLGSFTAFQEGIREAARMIGYNRKAPVRFAAGRPGFATIKGTANNAPVDLRLDRRAWTVKGVINNSETDLNIDHVNGKLTGGANRSPVDLTFRWTPESVSIDGGANNSPVKLVVDYKTVSIRGHVSHAPLKIEFDSGKSTFKGYAGRSQVSLAYDRRTGKMTGHMNNAPVDITLTNLELGTFLEYFFLFIN